MEPPHVGCYMGPTDAFNEAHGWRSITVVPLTSSERWQVASPTTVLFAAGESGLRKNCAAVAHQVTTIDREKVLEGKVGSLIPRKLAELNQAFVHPFGRTPLSWTRQP